MALDDDDQVIGTHRSHGHPIAKGADFGPLMAELMGREDGVCKGKGGSMHLADYSVGVMGESGIVGGGLPLATGAGLSAKVLGNGRVVCASSETARATRAAFHESLNIAAIWKLPVVYLCENNLYGATTPARERTSRSRTSPTARPATASRASWSTGRTRRRCSRSSPRRSRARVAATARP